MIRSFIAAIWIVIVALASVYFGTVMQAPRASVDATQTARAPASVKLQSMTVPVISGGALQGYVLTQVSVLVKPDLLKALPQPPDLLLNDEVFKTLYAEEQIDFKQMDKLDLVRLSQKIRDNINSRAGAPVAEDVFVQELHYMTKQDASAELRR